MTAGQKRLAIIEHVPLIHEGLRSLLTQYPEFELVASGSNLHDAVAICQNQKPEILLLDSHIQGNGLETARVILKSYVGVRVIMFAESENEEHIKICLDVGVAGYLLRKAGVEEVIDCLRAVAQSQRYINPALAAKILTSQLENPNQIKNGGVHFTGREKDVADLLVQGFSNRHIGEHLDLSEKTVKHHVSVIMEKLGVENRVKAALIISRQLSLRIN